ncbi:serine/threonine protein kinase [Marimonas sp. MJW-29]|uniref:non-specific serine/threonine protein kinase n=1 Tax=Sulfitobacter sediminis TaxID=3234186 RepID=A0ABV3RU93_9RHOB
MVSTSAFSLEQTCHPSPFYGEHASFTHDNNRRAEQQIGQHPGNRYQNNLAYLANPQPTATTAENIEFNGLPVGTPLLRNQYRIEKLLDAGGFGITYLARDSLERQVVIKECFPEMLCVRSEKSVKTRSVSQRETFRSVIQNFLREARRLAKLQHSNIVDVHQVFEENGTAYLAMDYVRGVDLLTLHEECPEKLSREILQKALCETLDALKYIHGLGILHRDISPDNIMLDEAGHLTLIDFGAARDNYIRHDRALTALVAVKDGYSPHEFYADETDQQASSDLYSLAATFYHLIRGEVPSDSQRRVSALASGKPDPYERLTEQDLDFDHIYLETIDRCLSISQKDRIQAAEDWLDILEAGTMQPNEAPTTPVELTEAVVDSIVALVEATNKDVNEAKLKTGDRKTQGKELYVQPQPKSAKQPVDLFGNPIHDVDAWLREQESMLASRRAKATEQLDDNRDHEADHDQRTAARGPLGTVFAWLFRSAQLEASRAQI